MGFYVIDMVLYDVWKNTAINKSCSHDNDRYDRSYVSYGQNIETIHNIVQSISKIIANWMRIILSDDNRSKT